MPNNNQMNLRRSQAHDEPQIIINTASSVHMKNRPQADGMSVSNPDDHLKVE